MAAEPPRPAVIRNPAPYQAAVAEDAQEKGEKLLKDIIGDEAYIEYRARGHIDVVSVKHENLVYRIRPRDEIQLCDRFGNYKGRTLCIHPQDRLVDGDEVVAHLMLCRYNEDLLWKTANEWERAA